MPIGTKGAGIIPFLAALIAVVVCVVSGLAISHVGPDFVVAAGALAIGAFALLLPPHLFVAATVLILGTAQLSLASPITVGAVSIYTTDLLVLLVLARTALSVAPLHGRIGLGRTATFVALAWLSILVIAMVRGLAFGTPAKVVVRDGTAIVVLPVLYLGLSHVIRERVGELRAVLTAVAAVICLFIAVAAISRVLSVPLAVGGASGLANVDISTGGVVLRDFGFETSFILFPVLGLGALAYLMFGPPRPNRHVAVVMIVGVAATLLTLERTEIVGLVVGGLGIFLLGQPTARRIRSALRLALGVGALAGCLAVVDSSLLTATLERTLPTASQSTQAVANADYRFAAAQTAAEFASKHPLGAGFTPVTVGGTNALSLGLATGSVDAGYLEHSTIAWLLYYTGWPGVIVGLAAWLAIGIRSFRVPAPEPWLHAAFCGIWLALLLYGAGAAGIVGQAWVMGVASLSLAIRFGPSRSSGTHQERHWAETKAEDLPAC